MAEREDFDKWFDSLSVVSKITADEWTAWQACAEAKKKRIAKLEEQRDKLLDALKKAITRQGFTNDELIDARAVIAKANER